MQELRFGDNDTLSAHVAALVRANWLFLMTDVDYLFTANPKSDPNAKPIFEVTMMSRREILHTETWFFYRILERLFRVKSGHLVFSFRSRTW